VPVTPKHSPLRMPYSSRNVFAGSIPAIRNVGRAVAMSAADANINTAEQIVRMS
jgi:hypothetical protein